MQSLYYGKRRKRGIELDWGLFWILEVPALAVPLFSAVLSLPRAAPLGGAKLVALLSIQLCFTIINFVWTWSRRLSINLNGKSGRHVNNR